jgi:hypothetical protein
MESTEKLLSSIWTQLMMELRMSFEISRISLYISKLYHQLFCSYTPDIDIGELITLKKAMNEHQLGPNGGLIYCLEYLEANVDWLVEKLKTVSGVLFQFEETKN